MLLVLGSLDYDVDKMGDYEVDKRTFTSAELQHLDFKQLLSPEEMQVLKLDTLPADAIFDNYPPIDSAVLQALHSPRPIP